MTPNGPAITPPAHHTPSRKDARTNRERILTAARSAFAASTGASLSAIARQAGVGIGTLYRHFPSREALIVELYRHEIQHLIDLAPALLESHQPLEALRLWFGEVARYGQLKYGAAEVIHAATSDDEYYEPFVLAIAILLDRGAADGSLKQGLDPGDVLLQLSIALNVARNVSRAARRQQAAMNRLPKAPDVPNFADDLVGRIDDAERLEKIHAALGTLRRTERDVLALCVWSGLNYAEAAEALGVPMGTVRSRLSRARRKLQREPGPASEQVTGDRVGGTR